VHIGAKNLKFYVDSGCSKHMTGEPTNFVNIKQINGGNVVLVTTNVVLVTTTKEKSLALEVSVTLTLLV
ncbi:hypothetical protein PIB30_109773, partial [Stylosanthes scabra]|nr:hypothetical protein [Stylosanthes scabra]